MVSLSIGINMTVNMINAFQYVDREKENTFFKIKKLWVQHF